MWELDYKESWAPKNWCFWTVVLEKTLESPLDCKEIQPVYPKGHHWWWMSSPTPGPCLKSCPSSRWCYPIISSSVVPFSSYLQSFPPSGSFPVSQFFVSGGQSIGVSVSASVLPMNIQGWFPLGLTSLISLQSKELSRVFSNTTVQKHQLFGTQLSSQFSSHIHTWPQEKP